MIAGRWGRVIAGLWSRVVAGLWCVNWLWLVIRNHLSNAVSLINEIHVAEIAGGVGVSVGEFRVGGVLGAWGACLDEAEAVGADDEGLLIFVVETIVAALAWVPTMVSITRGIASSRRSH
jgi:hypothetical protein